MLLSRILFGDIRTESNMTDRTVNQNSIRRNEMNKVQLPFGMQDYLPDDCYNKTKAEKAMCDTFASYGYKRVSTPTLEYADLFTAGGAINAKRLFKLTDSDGSLLALRADVTTQICRMYVTSMSGVQRMYYALDSYEYLSDTNSSRDREFAQTGVELLGDASADGELEILSMAADALKASGLKNFTVEIGHVGYFDGLAEQFGLTKKQTRELKTLINKKDMLGTELFFRDNGISDEGKESILSLPSLFGDASVLTKARKLCTNAKSENAIERLEYLLGKLEKAGLGKYFSIDLGMVSVNDYYTGLVMKGICDSIGASILDGGRYDKLCDGMGRSANAVGFAIGSKRLITALKNSGEYEKAPKADVAYAVIDCDEKTIRDTISKLRKRNIVVQIFGGAEDLTAYCEKKGIKRAILFDGAAIELTFASKGDKI